VITDEVTAPVHSPALGAIAGNAVFTTERPLVRKIVPKRTWFEFMTGKRTKS
jgi:hypothetical protein